MNTITRNEARAIGLTIRSQINPLVLMSLGAHELGFLSGDQTPGLLFKARILPFRKDGTRSHAPRIMIVRITLNPMDLYDINVSYGNRGEVVTHEEFEGIYAEDLNRVLLSLDSDDDR